MLPEEASVSDSSKQPSPSIPAPPSADLAGIASTSARIASTSAVGTSQLRDPREVALDATIFTPHGRIVFPRSDGDPSYGPPNTVVPGPSETQVNYYHIFRKGEHKWNNWAKTIAHNIAVNHFGLPDRNWVLDDFPKDYYMTEQRKGPQRGYRTDPYLFGSTAHRFRSTLEFMPHAVWLLRDPSLDPRNCGCIYCAKHSRGKGAGSQGVLVPKAGTKRPAASKPEPVKATLSATAVYRYQRMNYKIRSQAAPRGRQLPGVPLPIISVEERNDELAAVEFKQKGDREGFRKGELVLYNLKEPVVSPDDDHTRLTSWFAVVESSKLQVNVHPNERNGAKEDFNLSGRVHQKRFYDIVFLPTTEKARVEEGRLKPALFFRMPPAIRQAKLGRKSDHPWIEAKSPPQLNLENGKERPSSVQMLFAFRYAHDICQNLRPFYTATNKFSRAEKDRPAVTNLVHANGSVGSSAQAGPSSTDLGPNRFLSGVEQNNYMDLDSDDHSSRFRSNLRGSTRNTAAAASNSSTSSEVVPLDNNIYWQGILLGLERIWVGDLVRLRLSLEDCETMLSSLAKSNDLYNAQDRVKPDLQSSYIMRVKAIYRIHNAEPERTDDKIRVAGDIFRVMEVESSQSSGIVNTANQGTGATDEMREVEEQLEGVEWAKETIGAGQDIPNTAFGSDAYQGDHTVNKLLTKRPTFDVPFRPFLEKAYDDQLPKTPTLPEGFSFQRVNHPSVEVVCSVPQLAGRLWSSYHESGDDEVARKERKKQYLAHEDSDDPTRIRLSLTGLIAGAAKAMEVHTNEGHFASRDRCIAETSRLALLNRIEQLEKVRKGDDSGSQRQEAKPGTAAVGGKETTTLQSTSSDGFPTQKRQKIDSEIRHGVTGTSTSTMRPTQPPPSSSTVNKERSAATATPSTSVAAIIAAAAEAVLNAKREGKKERTGAHAASSILAQTKQADHSTATSSSENSVSPSNGETSVFIPKQAPPTNAAAARASSPPLPVNWVKRTSRSGGGTYFANIKTKETTWERPTA